MADGFAINNNNAKKKAHNGRGRYRETGTTVSRPESRVFATKSPATAATSLLSRVAHRIRYVRVYFMKNKWHTHARSFWDFCSSCANFYFIFAHTSG